MFAICAPLALLMVIFRGQIKEECIFFCQDYCFCSSKLKVSRIFPLFLDKWHNEQCFNFIFVYEIRLFDMSSFNTTEWTCCILEPWWWWMKMQCLILTSCMFLLFWMNCLESKGKHLFSTHLTVINTFGLKGYSFIMLPGWHMNLVLYTFRKSFSVSHVVLEMKTHNQFTAAWFAPLA